MVWMACRPLKRALIFCGDVRRVCAPALKAHPTHQAARRQFKGFGTIISFDVKGDAATADAVCDSLKLITMRRVWGSGVDDRAARGA